MKKNRVCCVLVALFAFTQYAHAYYEGSSQQDAYFGYGAGGSNTSGVGNAFIGFQAGLNNVSGNYNTFLGFNAGAASTASYNTFLGWGAGGSSTTGINNVFVGSLAGFSNLTGSNNAFLGYQAGYSILGGAQNTMLGYQAGYTTGNGAGNTFVGNQSGFANDTGTDNTFLGENSGHSTTTSNNTFVGSFAGYSNVAGTSNVLVGSAAGWHNVSGSGNTFVGYQAGDFSLGDSNTMLGNQAGFSNTSGTINVFVGDTAGYSNTTGAGNTFIGKGAGSGNTAGGGNVFLGYNAGSIETGSNRLYIDNCLSGGSCTSPFIYGEFDNHLLKINGVANVAANGVAKSQMHFSLDNGDYGGFLTSVLPNNFFVSSGARYDSGNWVQRSADGNAVMAGSGGAGYRIFTHTGAAVGSTFTNLALRLQIDYSGQFGINTAPVAGDEIHTSSGAHLTAGGVWTDASSREYKDNIRPLTTEEAQQTLAALDPVRYNYKVSPEEKHVGFIAEDVPELVAREDRKSLSPMDIVAVLTKVVQEQKQTLDALATTVSRLEAELDRFKSKELVAGQKN